MNNENNSIRKTGSRAGLRKGSMVMEYAVVVCGIAVVLCLFMNLAFYNEGEGFGPLGQGIVAFYQRLQGGLALPIP